LYHYDGYYQPVDSFYYGLDDDYVATQTLIQNFPKYNYNSFIFGSSRSDNYMVSEWRKHTKADNGYHFNAAHESLYGVAKKVEYLKNQNRVMKNALFIMDAELLSGLSNDNGHIGIKHPATSGESYFQFQAEFVKDYFDKDFLFAYLDLLFTKKVKPYMTAKGVIGLDRFHYDVTSNEFLQSYMENMIITDSPAYYAGLKDVFYERPATEQYSKPVIGAEQIKLLNSIKATLTAHKTDYRIVISPLYNQQKLDTTDLRILQKIFGAQYVFDFSGITEVSKDKHNYYEASHYRPHVCTAIMNKVYGE
jgi:hypothetical protein